MDDDHIKSLLLQDRKIQSIKFVIDQTGWGLKKSKDYVDALQQSLLQDRKIQAIRLVMQQNELRSRKSKDYVEDLQRELLPRSADISNVPDEPNECMVKRVSQLITQGRKIEAIQLLHHATDMTLKESKDYIDRLDLEHPLHDV